MIEARAVSATVADDIGFDLGIEGGIVLDASGVPRQANVYVRDGRIAAVTPEWRPSARTLRRDGAVVIPGFVNLHLHTRPGRALGDGLPLMVWHERWADGLTLRMQPGDGYAGAALAFSECLLGGTTAVVVMTPHYLEAAQAARDLGIRAIVVPLAVDEPDARGTGDDLLTSIKTIAALGPQHGERVQVWLGFDGVESTSEAGMRAVAEAARSIPIGIHTHINESEEDTRKPHGTKGLAGVELLADCGLLDQTEPVVLAHCNWLTEEEMAAFVAAPSVVVAHNPTSNMRLGVGICPVADLRQRGVRLGLGTDGMLSNFFLDFFQVMRGACMLHRIANLNANALSSRDVFMLATVGGQLFDERAGEIIPAAPADLVVLDPNGPHFLPRIDFGEDSNLLALVVWCAGPADVRDVVVDGEVVVAEGVLRSGRLSRIETAGQRALERILTEERDR
jgi:5-methylthioadenosine/S-adenosylhomocysteine deaminase